MTDGAGGAILVWKDERVGFRIYTQKINGNGIVQWTANGLAVVLQSNYFDYTASPDATNASMLLSWNLSGDIKAQKINIANGSVLWGSGGTLLCGRSDTQEDAAITHNGTSGAIISWTDDRNSGTTSEDIYANRVLTNGTLPLTLIEFSAAIVQENVLLKWLTTNEQNTLDFEIERSTDNIPFTYLGTVDAAGFSQVNKNYSFIDKSPLKGTTYYRLKQRDKDGTFTYSPVRRVVINNGSSIVKLLGNPVHNLAVLQYISNHFHTAQLRIIDQSGKTVIIKQVSVTAGANQIRFATSQFPKGIYEVQIVSATDIQKLRMIKD